MYFQTRSLLLIALMAALTGVGGFIRIPVSPVPFTLQTLFVYLSADLLGKKGALSQIIFITLGLVGVPIFAMGGGIGYILQPTFGYLLGFPIGAWVVGALVEKMNNIRRFWGLALANGAGLVVIHFFGVIYLWININYIVQMNLSWIEALWSGFLIFLPSGVIKATSAALLSSRLMRLSDFV